MAEDRTAEVHVEYDIKITPKLVWAIVAPYFTETVSYTHLTLPTNREV